MSAERNGFLFSLFATVVSGPTSPGNRMRLAGHLGPFPPFQAFLINAQTLFYPLESGGASPVRPSPSSSPRGQKCPEVICHIFLLQRPRASGLRLPPPSTRQRHICPATSPPPSPLAVGKEGGGGVRHFSLGSPGHAESNTGLV